MSRIEVINGKKTYWSPRMDCYLPIKKQVKRKKTYLTYILDKLNELNDNENENDTMAYELLVNNIKQKWNEEVPFKEEYFVKSLIKGVSQGKIEKIEVAKEKNKYKGHYYKLITS